MSTAKKQHYVPKFYLEGFTREGLLWVYDRETERYRQDKPKNVAFQTHYYTVMTEQGTKDASVERFFALIENWAAPVVAKLAASQTITPDEKERLALFAGFQSTRVPDVQKAVEEASSKLAKKLMRFGVSSEARAAAMLRRFEADTGQKAGLTPKEVYDVVQGEGWGMEFPRGWSLDLQLRTGQQAVEWLLVMDWILLQAPRTTAFVTTDAPFVLIPRRDYDPKHFYKSAVGLLTAGARVLPLSAQMCLLFGNPGERFVQRTTTREMVRKINIALAVHSDRLVIARDREQLEHLIKRTHLSQWRTTERVRVSSFAG